MTHGPVSGMLIVKARGLSGAAAYQAQLNDPSNSLGWTDAGAWTQSATLITM